MFAVHPHCNINATTVIFLFGATESLFHIKCVATSVLFWLPLWKDFMGWGGVIPANRYDIERALAIQPEGVRGVTGLDPERMIEDGGVVKRRGFIQCALKACVVTPERNLYLVPVWSVSEHE